jgi:hypothetical protein
MATDGLQSRMARKNHSFTLRIMQRDPDTLSMSRLGEYLVGFAALLGIENKPIFRGVKKGSTRLLALTPPDRTPFSRALIKQAKSDPTSKPARHLHTIESMLGEDAIAEAQILDENDNVIYGVFGHRQEDEGTERLFQEGWVDGEVTGLVGADETMHLHLRDHFERGLKLNVRDVALARDLLTHFRIGSVRLLVRGTWIRTENGWSPEASRCTVQRFEALVDTPISQILAAASRVKGNGWGELADPIGMWEDIRGLH